MRFDKLRPIAGKLGVFILVFTGLLSVIQFVSLNELLKTRNRAENYIEVQITRPRCLLDSLPDEVDSFGFLPSLPRRMEDPNINRSILRRRTDDYRILYLTQFSLAPRVIAFYAEANDWVIANYPDHETGLEAVRETGYEIIKDCRNGVFLLSR